MLLIVWLFGWPLSPSFKADSSALRLLQCTRFIADGFYRGLQRTHRFGTTEPDATPIDCRYGRESRGTGEGVLRRLVQIYWYNIIVTDILFLAALLSAFTSLT